MTLNAFILLSQLNIVNDKMYEVLSDIYKEYLQLFDTDVVHMGGDEVNMNCYNTSAEIRKHLELHDKTVSFSLHFSSLVNLKPTYRMDH